MEFQYCIIYAQPLKRYANNPLEEIISSAVWEESLNKLNLQADSRAERLGYGFYFINSGKILFIKSFSNKKYVAT